MGIFSFVQISEWETEDVAEIAKALGISPTKIIQDDWVGQAQMLVAGPQP
jgi:predicted flap endonuclease-1-like 5' DNA nuclease